MASHDQVLIYPPVLPWTAAAPHLLCCQPALFPRYFLRLALQLRQIQVCCLYREGQGLSCLYDGHDLQSSERLPQVLSHSIGYDNH